MQEIPKIVVTMIVKNEAHVIERCLNSLRPIIDAFCIVDTGSTDGTQEVIRKAMSGIPGEVYDIPWKNFAYNRSKALELSRQWGDYSLMIDADEEAHFSDDFDSEKFRKSLKHDVYNIMYRNGCLYVRPQITSTRLPFLYKGILHEYLEVPPNSTLGGNIKEFYVHSNPDGARSSNPNKYKDDALLFEEALKRNDEPDLKSRYLFYCAQSYRDCGDLESSIIKYKERAELGGWNEEIYVSWLWHARLSRATGKPVENIFDSLLKACDAVPARAEALVFASAVAREEGRLPTAFIFAKRAVELSPYDNALFLEPDAYLWKAKYELSIACYYVREHSLGLKLSEELLQSGFLPQAESEAVSNNLAIYKKLV